MAPAVTASELLEWSEDGFHLAISLSANLECGNRLGVDVGGHAETML